MEVFVIERGTEVDLVRSHESIHPLHRMPFTTTRRIEFTADDIILRPKPAYHFALTARNFAPHTDPGFYVFIQGKWKMIVHSSNVTVSTRGAVPELSQA